MSMSYPEGRRAALLLFFCLISLSGGVFGCSEGTDEPAKCGEETRCQAVEWPTWALKDIQPRSAKYEQSYGLDAFEGKTLVVSFLVGWCPYCRAQALKLEQMQKELGADVQFVVIHGASANNAKDQTSMLYVLDDEGGIKKDDQGNDVSRFTFPAFQDTEAINAWSLHEGAKDDFFIYTPGGQLSAYFPSGSGMNLAEAGQYDRLKDAIVAASKK